MFSNLSNEKKIFRHVNSNRVTKLYARDLTNTNVKRETNQHKYWWSGLICFLECASSDFSAIVKKFLLEINGNFHIEHAQTTFGRSLGFIIQNCHKMLKYRVTR